MEQLSHSEEQVMVALWDCGRLATRKQTYCGATSAAHLQRLYGGDARAMFATLTDTGRISFAALERLARYLDTRAAESPEYDYD